MQTVPKFITYDDNNTLDGVFDWGKSRDEIIDLYYDASDRYNMGKTKDAKETLLNIIDRDPHFIDAYNLLGTIEAELGNPDKGLKLQKKALVIGEKIIPDSFNGSIRWGFTENRPFLRAILAMAINNAYAGKFSKSVRLLERIMRYNSDDNQGARYMLGDLYFLQNSFQKAEEIYKNNLDYPPYLYSLGLLEFSLGNRVKAISFLRKGILENIYISDHLRMKGPLIPYEIWHGTNFERPETAYSYLDLMIQKWVQYPEAVELLQFLHLAEPSNFEIQNTYMLKNELYFADNSFGDEQTNSLRNEIINDIENVKKGINQTSSKEILKRWQNNTLQETFREQ